MDHNYAKSERKNIEKYQDKGYKSNYNGKM